MASPSDPLLFVYGSLRRDTDHPMARYLQTHSQLIGNAIFQGKLFDTGSFPAAIKSTNPNDQVLGELYAMKNVDRLLEKLDNYEGFEPEKPEQSLFLRKKVEVQPSSGDKLVPAWTYLFNRPVTDFQAIPSGDYIEYRTSDNDY